MKFIKNPCSIITIVKVLLLGVSFYYFTFFMFYFGAILLIATGYHNDVEIEQISNYRIAHLKI